MDGVVGFAPSVSELGMVFVRSDCPTPGLSVFPQDSA